MIVHLGGETLWFTRRKRRDLTLRQAKRMAKKAGMDRRAMFSYREDLMRAFPRGTIELKVRKK